jgi:hypothetical protein
MGFHTLAHRGLMIYAKLLPNFVPKIPSINILYPTVVFSMQDVNPAIFNVHKIRGHIVDKEMSS